MEETTFNIFQNLAFPIAVSAVLFVGGFYFAKKMLQEMHEREQSNLKLRDQYIAYLQMANTELIGAIKENSTAFNNFSQTLDEFKKLLKDH